MSATRSRSACVRSVSGLMDSGWPTTPWRMTGTSGSADAGGLGGAALGAAEPTEPAEPAEPAESGLGDAIGGLDESGPGALGCGTTIAIEMTAKRATSAPTIPLSRRFNGTCSWRGPDPGAGR